MAERARTLLALSVALSLVDCARAHSVELSLGGPSQFSGFVCVADEPPRTPLLQRALDAGSVTMVADFITVPANVTAAGDVLLRACSGGECRTMPGRRSVFRIQGGSLRLPSNPTSDDLARAVAGALGEWNITANAPDGLVVVRIVATTQSADTVLRTDSAGRYLTFDASALVGCAITPAIEFDTASSPVYLSLPAFGASCTESQVARCAGVP